MLSRLLGFLVLASAIGLSSAGYRVDYVAAAQSDSATGTAAGVLSRTNALPSWNDGPAKKELLYFLWRVTREGGTDFVPDDRRSPIGMLDTALDHATARGWTVVSMKDDWRTVFPR